MDCKLTVIITVECQKTDILRWAKTKMGEHK